MSQIRKSIQLLSSNSQFLQKSLHTTPVKHNITVTQKVDIKRFIGAPPNSVGIHIDIKK